MPEWQLHWLEAEDDLRPWRDRIAAEIEVTQRAIAELMPIPAIDVLVQRQERVIPEIGMVGMAYRKSLFSLSFNVSNPNFERCLIDGALRRQVAHEVHHCLRMAGPGYGHTLGEALVSEGLAGRFVGHLFKSGPEPWECAVGEDELAANLPDAAALASPYQHNEWFFGANGIRPRWLGYTLGYKIVGDWLENCGEIDGSTWVNVPAATVLASAMKRS